MRGCSVRSLTSSHSPQWRQAGKAGVTARLLEQVGCVGRVHVLVCACELVRVHVCQ